MARAVVALLLLLLAAVVGVWALDAAMANAGEDFIVTNESWTPSAGSVTQLENSELAGGYYGNTTTVYDENGTEMDRGTDYTWFEDNGTVKALVGGGLDGDASATISYTYQQTTSEQRALAGIAAIMPEILGIIAPLIGIALLLVIIRG